MKILELFSGTQSISKVFRANKWQCFTIDNNPVFEKTTTWSVNILEVTAQDILDKFGRPDVIWASPPCTAFSVAAMGKHWGGGNQVYRPNTEFAKLSMQIVKHTLKLIEELKPKYYFIENPRGVLRKLRVMKGLPRYTITYCQYGDKRMKPTDIWTNHPNPKFKPMCKNNAKCHERAPRGSDSGTQGLKDAIERARLPKDLCRHIYKISMEEME